MSPPSQPSIMLHAGTCQKCHEGLRQPLSPGEGTVLGCRRCNPNIPTGPLPPPATHAARERQGRL